MKLTLGILSVLALAELPAYAHIGRALQVPTTGDLAAEFSVSGRRQHLHARASPKNAADMAKIQDSSQECQEYGYPASQALSKKYPGYHIASLVDGDDQAQQVWSEVQQSGIIPSDIQPRGATKGHYGISDDSSNSYNNDKDPDCWWTATGCTSPKHPKIGDDMTSCPEPNTWGLTFDDGPNCSHNAFYDYLSKNKLKATMFFIGTNVMDLPFQAQRALADGHDICLHTWSHRYMTTLSNEQVFSELYYTMRIIKDIVGVTPRCWRPPYGDVDDRVRAIAAGLGLRTIIWSHDTDDWNIIPDVTQPTSKIDSNYQKIIDKQTQNKLDGKGVNVLTHELTDNTMGEFQKEFPKIKEAFANVVPLTACFNVTQPYAESQYKYPIFADFIKGNISPQGVPSLDQMPQINVSSKIDVTPEKQQTGAGGFSSASKPVDETTESDDADMSSSKSSNSSASSSSSNAATQGSSKNADSDSSAASIPLYMSGMLAPILLSFAML